MSLIWNNRDENQSSLFKLQFLRKFSSKEIFAGKIFSKEIGKIQSNSRNLRGRFSWNPHTVYYICGVQYRAPPVDFTFRYFGLKGKKKKKRSKEKEKKFRSKTCNNCALGLRWRKKNRKNSETRHGIILFLPSCTYVFLNIHLLSSDYREISPFPLVFTSC